MSAMRLCLEVVLFAAPFLTLFAVLASGRFPGEGAILARRRRAGARPRGARLRWHPRVERAPASLLERTGDRLRGPPAIA
jgi:hypothetical protein